MTIVSWTERDRDMTAFTYDENIFGDLYKEVYGVRPRDNEWFTATPERKQVLWNNLLEAHDAEMEDYHREQIEAIDHFETLVQNTFNYGATTYKQAIKWLMQAIGEDAEETRYDYLEYQYNLPCGYIKTKLT